MTPLIRRLESALLANDGGPTDGQLLHRFVLQRDEAAFEALVHRLGPMVLGVCRRLLDAPDAEDAFQATFLVLLRKASSVVPSEKVGSWLHGVAHRTALQVRKVSVRRRTREKQVEAMPDSQSPPAPPVDDLLPVLDDELNQLPEKYRASILLCDLQGRSRKEAARQLGLPEGTLSSRLATGRAMLAKRLARRGVAVGTVPVAGLLGEQAARALPAALVRATVNLATLGAIPARIAFLTEGVLKIMLLSKLKGVTACVLVLAMVASGGALYRGWADGPRSTKDTVAQKKTDQTPNTTSPSKEDDKGKPAKKPSRTEPGDQARKTQQKLTELVTTKKLDDPTYTLELFLNHLAERYDLPEIDINTAAFAEEGLMDVSAFQLTERPMLPMKNVRLSTVLRKALERIPVPSGATYVIHDDRLEITTRNNVLARFYRKRKTKEDVHDTPSVQAVVIPLVHVAFDKTPLDEALKELSRTGDGYNIVVNTNLKEATAPVTARLKNVPLDTAVWLLADMAGLQVVEKDNLWYVTKQPAK